MKKSALFSFALLPLGMILGQPVAAQAPASPFTGAAPVTDLRLARTNGTNATSPGSIKAASQNESSAFFDWAGRNGRTQMDVWWGTIGSELVAEAVRNGLN